MISRFEGIDSKGIDQEPERDHNRTWIPFYIGFIVLGSYFTMNLFAAVMVDSFYTERGKNWGHRFFEQRSSRMGQSTPSSRRSETQP